MAIRRRQIITSTQLDRQNERVTKGALEGMVEHMRGRVIPINVEHDPRDPPIGIMHDATLIELQDGEFAVEAESYIWESAQDFQEVLALGAKYEPPVPSGDRALLSLDYSYYREPEAQKSAKEFSEKYGISLGHYAKKAVDPISQLTIAVGLFVAGSVAAGFFGKMGSDAYDALKGFLADLVGKNKSSGDKLLVFQFGMHQDGYQYLVEVALENATREDVQWFLDNGIAQVDQWLLRTSPADDRARRIFMVVEGRKLRVRYGINESGIPLKFTERKGQHDEKL